MQRLVKEAEEASCVSKSVYSAALAVFVTARDPDAGMALANKLTAEDSPYLSPHFYSLALKLCAKVYTLPPIPYTLHPTPYTLPPIPYTIHPTHYTLHPTPYTHTLYPISHHISTRSRSNCVPRFTPLPPNPTPYTIHHAPYTLHPLITCTHARTHTHTHTHTHSLSLSLSLSHTHIYIYTCTVRAGRRLDVTKPTKP